MPLDNENVDLYGQTNEGTPFNKNFISYALVKKLATKGAVEFELPDELKETYPTLNFIKAQDYINFLSNYDNLGIWKNRYFSVIYKNWEPNYEDTISPCLQKYINENSLGSNPKELGINFELWSLFDFGHPFDSFNLLENDDRSDFYIEIELKGDKLVSSLVTEPLASYNYWNERFKKAQANKDNLSLESQNAVNLLEKRIKDFEISLKSGLEITYKWIEKEIAKKLNKNKFTIKY